MRNLIAWKLIFNVYIGRKIPFKIWREERRNFDFEKSGKSQSDFCKNLGESNHLSGVHLPMTCRLQCVCTCLLDPRRSVSADTARPHVQGDECACSRSDAVHSSGSRVGLAWSSKHRSSSVGRQQNQEAVCRVVSVFRGFCLMTPSLHTSVQLAFLSKCVS